VCWVVVYEESVWPKTQEVGVSGKAGGEPDREFGVPEDMMYCAREMILQMKDAETMR
jgi:hypothetical protein